MVEERKKKRRPNKKIAQSSASKPKHNKKELNHQNITVKKEQKRPDAKNRKRKKKNVSQKRKITSTQKVRNPLYAFLFNVLFYSLILFMIVGSIIFATTKNADKSILGYRFFGVLTDSMVPRDPKNQKGGFHSGDVIIVKNIDGNEANVGDIITFRPSIKSQAFLTHRVKEKLDQLGDVKGTYYITQGDANLAEDVPISENQVVGKKILVVPKIGAFLNFIRENLLVSSIFLISVFGFITVVRYYILNK